MCPPGSTQGGPCGLYQARHQPGPHSSSWPPQESFLNPKSPGTNAAPPVPWVGGRGGTGTPGPQPAQPLRGPETPLSCPWAGKAPSSDIFIPRCPPGTAPPPWLRPQPRSRPRHPPASSSPPFPSLSPFLAQFPFWWLPPRRGSPGSPQSRGRGPDPTPGPQPSWGKDPAPSLPPPTPRTMGPCGMGSDARGGN